MPGKTIKPIAYNPGDMPKDILAIAYYRRFVAILFVTNILMCIAIVYMISSYDRRENEFLARLKTRDVVVMDGNTIKTVRVGNKGHKVARKFALDSIKDMLSYSADNYQDAIKTAQMVAIPEIAEKHEKAVMDELDPLRNRGGYYLVRFKKGIKIKRGLETGDWLVVIPLERIYRNALKEREVKQVKVYLTIKDTNYYARADIDKHKDVSEIDMIITEMSYDYS